MDFKSELKDVKEPAMVSALTVGACLILRKLTGTSFGVDTHNMAGAAKAFAVITLSGGAVAWYNSKN